MLNGAGVLLTSRGWIVSASALRVCTLGSFQEDKNENGTGHTPQFKRAGPITSWGYLKNNTQTPREDRTHSIMWASLFCRM